MHDPDWVYTGVIKDINTREGYIVFIPDNPQHPWQVRMEIKSIHAPKVNVGDMATVLYVLSHGSGYYAIDKVEPTANPGKPTYEIVNEGRWYDKYLCCSKAFKSPTFCVCSAYIDCPVHGSNHHGTHD